MRYFVLRFALFVLLFTSVAGFGQDSSSNPEPQAPAAAQVVEPQSVSVEVAEAEAAIVKSNWKTAGAKLDLWLATHPGDARALFDAAYVADAQNRLDDAVGLYQRAAAANPTSFEAHVELGMLLARQGKPAEARPELAAATQLDPGEAGAAAKARAWRALAEIDRADNPAQASEDLLEALKLSPETEDDALLAASLADQAGQSEAAETAYRRILAKDPKSAPANAGLAHLLIAHKQYPEAETLLRAALVQSPEDIALTAQLAAVLAAQDKAEALPLFQKLHSDYPGNPAITRMLAEVLADAGAHGQNLIRLLKYAEAYAVFDKATKLDSANADGWVGLAFAASKTNRPAVTLHALTMRSKYLPEVPSTYFLWATAYDALHDKAAATTYYHHFLDSSAGKNPDLELEARQHLRLLEGKK
jgi:tetratricopeptide (TPR) repeat protein